MSSVTHQSLRALGYAVLIGGLLAGSLTGCAARRLRAAETATASAAGQPTAAGSDLGNTTPAAPAANPADQIDAELDKMNTELNSADTLNDFSTALPPDAAIAAATTSPAGTDRVTSTLPANAATAGPKATAAPSGNDQGVQIDQMLSAMQIQLNKTDTVPEGANP
jgi:hypothetical protein